MTPTKYNNVYVENTEVYRLINGKYHKLCQYIDNVGYFQVVFRIDGKRVYVRVHRLIAETLIPNPDHLPQVNHIDGNKLNNNLSNLEWCTLKHNVKEGYRTGCYKSRFKCPIEVTFDTGEKRIFPSIRSCAKELNINRKTLTSILKGIKVNNYSIKFKYTDECIDHP